MSKQTNFLGFILSKLLACILLSIALMFVYNSFSNLNVDVVIKFSDYNINTSSGFLFFALLCAILILFLLNGFIGSIVNSFYNFRERYRGSRISSSISYLIESAILLAIGSKKEALKQLANIDTKYLSDEQKGYVDLIHIFSSSEGIPLTLIGSVQKFPFIKNQISKKLAIVEYKLGNLEKALEFARQYYSINSSDEEINLLIARIYSRKQDWKAMDGTISSVSHHEISIETKNNLANLYLLAARDQLNKQNINDLFTYCSKALEFKPDFLEAASLFAEVAASQKNYDAAKINLLNAFATFPNFQIFLILKKFSDSTNSELYYKLVESCDFLSHQNLFLSIATVLELKDAQKEILEKINNGN